VVQPIVENEFLIQEIFVDDSQAPGLFGVQAKVLMEPSKLRIRHSRACWIPCHSMVDFRKMLVTEELLM
jgi:hypothetical protein